MNFFLLGFVSLRIVVLRIIALPIISTGKAIIVAKQLKVKILSNSCQISYNIHVFKICNNCYNELALGDRIFRISPDSHFDNRASCKDCSSCKKRKINCLSIIIETSSKLEKGLIQDSFQVFLWIVTYRWQCLEELYVLPRAALRCSVLIQKLVSVSSARW